MRLKPFLLDNWLNEHQFTGSGIKHHLGASTGPEWTTRSLVELIGSDQWERLLDDPVTYVDARGTKALREAIAEMEQVHPDQVQIVTGAAEALLILFFLAAEPGANVIVPFPGFPPFAVLPESFGIETRLYHLRRENQFRIDLDEIVALADDKTRLVLVNLPHNPTGAVVSEEQLKAIHDFTAARGIQLVVDQVYHPIYHGAAVPSASGLSHATVLGDFSKALSLSGLRVGWMIDRDRNRLEQYCDARSYFTISNTRLGEGLAVGAIQNRQAIFDRVRRTTEANLRLLDSFFSRLSGVLDWVRPQGGMTAFPWLANGADSRPMCQELASKGVLLAPGDCFGMPEYFRLGFGSIEEGFDHALQQMERVIDLYFSSAMGTAR